MAAVVVFLVLFCVSASATPERGQWSVSLPLDKVHKYVAFPKHMYKDSKVSVTVTLHCKGTAKATVVDIEWMMRVSPCAMEFLGAEELFRNISEAGDVMRGEDAFAYPVWFEDPPYDEFEYIHNNTGSSACRDGQAFPIGDHRFQCVLSMKTLHRQKGNTSAGDAPSENGEPAASAADSPPATGDSQSARTAARDQPPASSSQQKENQQTAAATDTQAGGNQPPADSAKPTGSSGAKPGQLPGAGQPGTLNNPKAGDTAGSRKRREVPALSTPALTPQPKPTPPSHPVTAKTWVDGNYLLILKFSPEAVDQGIIAEVQVRMTWGDGNYLSALDYPLLIFYGVLGLVYIVMGLIWLVLLACNWRDLLRVQFWIGGVIFLGMLEKAVFFAEYENVNKYGVSVSGAVIFAELVSCLKRTLARMLVIIVSLGFGIVKPRLGQAFHKVLFVGALFFILAAIEGCMRATSSKVDQSNQFLLAAVPLAVLDAVICWWIFSSLVQTTRTLRLRRNIVKLSLYRHFTNTLIFAVLASVAYMIWFMTQHKFQECVRDWKQLWVDEAFWHMLFVVLLFIIMLLWRPTANNQRYAFSPLLDAADEEEEDETVMNDAFEGMKMRGVKQANGSPKQREPKSKVEDDLKWVEEHIPSSVADKALPSLLDSDEELMTTKFEMSKME